MIPKIPTELPFDSKQIAQHIARNLANLELFTEQLLNSDGLLTPNAHDFFLDQVDNESDIVASYECYGSGGEFVVSIMEWRAIFWVQAPEFSNIGYFLDIEEAKFFAEDIAESYPNENTEE